MLKRIWIFFGNLLISSCCLWNVMCSGNRSNSNHTFHDSFILVLLFLDEMVLIDVRQRFEPVFGASNHSIFIRVINNFSLSSMEVRSKRKSILAMTFVTVFIDALNNSFAGAILPYMILEMESTPFQEGLVFSIYSLMQLLSNWFLLACEV